MNGTQVGFLKGEEKASQAVPKLSQIGVNHVRSDEQPALSNKFSKGVQMHKNSGQQLMSNSLPHLIVLCICTEHFTEHLSFQAQ